MKKNLISIILLAVSVVLSVVLWLVLPDVVAVQIGMSGEVTNTMPKVLAILIPLGVSVFGSVMNLTGKAETKIKGYVSMGIGIFIMLFTLIFNL